MVRNTRDVLDENTQRTTGKNAQISNIEAAKAVAEIVRTTLGPMGMDKMLVDSLGDVVITNDGVKILKEMEIEHPGAKIIVEVAKTQEAEVGDGTTSAVILSGELLSNAQDLIDKKIHPTNIVRAYKKASKKALEILEKNSKKVNISDKKILKEICETAMIGKVAEYSRNELSEIIFEAVNLVKEETGIPKNRIKITKAVGGNIEDSFIVKGVVLDKELANPNMPSKIKNPKILLIDFPLEVREIEADAKININSLDEYEAFVKSEEDYLRSLVVRIKEIGSNVVVCQKGIDDGVAYYLAKEGIIGIRRNRRSDMEKLSFALGCPIVSSINDLEIENLGKCERVERREILNENYIFIEGCSNPKAISLFLKASTKHVLDEIERAVEDSLGDLNSILKSKRIVAGGGAIELELYKKLLEFSKEFVGKEELIVKAFANSFLSIPRILCENSGFEEIEIMSQLISNHDKGEKNCGINGFEGIVADTIKCGILEPINVKSQAIKSATESSSMILRIDDIIAAKRLKGSDISTGNDEF
ncbi:MAG: thermosome subunit [Nanoarchaeota archaeon]|nr:thermosome subunit [Nanoarchaeota archaeon]